MSDTIIVIPAKGDSKRLYQKNKLILGGQFGDLTLVEIAIKRSLESKLGEVVVVSDDSDILFSRPRGYYKALEMPKSISKLRAIDAILFAIGEEASFVNLIVTLPTASLCSYLDMIAAYQIFMNNIDKSIVSVTRRYGNPTLFMEALLDKTLTPIINNPYFFAWKKSIADGPKDYLKINGGVFVCTIEKFRKDRDWYSKEMMAYEMSEERGLDIDTELDYKLAKVLVERRK